jgi:hypothetical protein
MRTQIFAYLSTIWCQNKKTVSFTVALLILFLFGDTLIPLVGHCLHLLLEVIESTLEHFLEAAFGFSARQAQIILFYSFCIMMSYSAWYVARKVYFSALHGYEIAQTFWRTPKVKAWIKAMLMFGALGTTVYIFS